MRETAERVQCLVLSLKRNAYNYILHPFFMDFPIENVSLGALENELVLVRPDKYVLPVYSNICTSRFAPFHYFGPVHLVYSLNLNPDFLVAWTRSSSRSKRNHRYPVGVLKYRQEEFCGYEHTMIEFIDVHKKYRQRGIATSLVRALNGLLPEGDVVVSTPLSPEGKNAQLDAVLRREMTRCSVFVPQNDLDELSTREKARLRTLLCVK